MTKLSLSCSRWPAGFALVVLSAVGCGPAPLGPDVGRPQPVGADTTLPAGSPNEPAPKLPPSAASSVAPPTTDTAVPSAAPAASTDAPAAGPGKAATATLGEPKFEGGEVPKAKGVLDKMAKTLGKCVTDHGGLRAAKGVIEVQFLVRAQGIAEGVDVLSASGVDDEAKKCVRDALKKKTIGPPSADPVGVTVKIELEAAAGSSK